MIYLAKNGRRLIYMPTFYQKRKTSFQCYISHNLTYPSHLHKQLELIYVLHGNVQVTINDVTLDLLPGDISIAFPNTIHSISTADRSDILLIIFDSYLVEDYSSRLMNYKPTFPFMRSENQHQDISYCIQNLMKINMLSINYTLLKSYLTIILCHLLDKLELAEMRHDDIDLVQQVLEYIDNHYTETITLDSMATNLNASKFYLSRIFSNKLKTTFNQYLNNRRVQLARHLLISTELSITEISYQAGFDSTRTFYRVFKDQSGVTPKEYRINLKQ